MLRYARLRLFYRFLGPYQERTRRRRSAWFSDLMGLRPNMNIIDLGGSPKIWKFVDTPLNIILLNLEFEEGARAQAGLIRQHKFTFVNGDACAVGMPSKSFDLTFSNSVIEHVGDGAQRAAFAHEARRLAPKYWVQTPAKYFPIEAHTGMPFWWYYPEGLRQSLKAKWKPRLPAWTEMIEGTTLLEREEIQRIFPEATLMRERSFGFVKSYIAYRA